MTNKRFKRFIEIKDSFIILLIHCIYITRAFLYKTVKYEHHCDCIFL